MGTPRLTLFDRHGVQERQPTSTRITTPQPDLDFQGLTMSSTDFFVALMEPIFDL
jgi:hypothetical protein